MNGDAIDVWLTNRDLLTPVQGMVLHLAQCQQVGRIRLVDCASTFPPLLEWYERQTVAEVIRAENLGPRAIWKYATYASGQFFFASDADLDLTGVPFDCLVRLRQYLFDHPETLKSGLSLRLYDVPEAATLSPHARAIEQKFWEQSTPDNLWYHADIDTTAAMCRGGQGWTGYGPAVRAAPPYTARHLSWYLTPDTITDEWRWYLTHLNPRGIVYSQTLRFLLGLSDVHGVPVPDVPPA